MRLGWQWLWAGWLLAVPLVFCRGFAEQFTFTKVLAAKLIVLCGLVGWGVRFLWGREVAPRRAWLRWPLLALLLSALLSLRQSPSVALSLREFEYILCGPAVLLLFLATARGREDLERASSLILIAGMLVGTIALLQRLGFDLLQAGGYRVAWGTMMAKMRAYSTLGNPNFVGGYLIGTFFLGFAGFHQGLRLFPTLAAVAIVAGIIVTQSSGAYLGFLAGAATYFWLGRKMRPKEKARPPASWFSGRRTWLILSLVLLLGITVFLAWPSSRGLAGMLHAELQGRFYLWRVGWPLVREHLLWGAGLASYRLHFLVLQGRFLADPAHASFLRFWSNAPQAHNDFLQLLAEMGLVGLCAFLWLLGNFAREARAVWRSDISREAKRLIQGSVAGVVALLVDGLLNFQFAIPPTFLLFWTLLAFPAVILGSQESLQETASPRESSAPPSRHVALWWARWAGSFILLAAASLAAWFFFQPAWAERQYALGRRFELRGDYAGAAATYRAGLEHDRLHGLLHFGLARALYYQGEPGSALLEVALARQTLSDSHLDVLEGRAFEELGRRQEALGSYRRALWLEPRLESVPADIERLAGGTAP